MKYSFYQGVNNAIQLKSSKNGLRRIEINLSLLHLTVLIFVFSFAQLTRNFDCVKELLSAT